MTTETTARREHTRNLVYARVALSRVVTAKELYHSVNAARPTTAAEILEAIDSLQSEGLVGTSLCGNHAIISYIK